MPTPPSAVRAGPEPEPCLNCGAVLSDRFCGSCGQARLVARVRLRDWVAEAWESLVSLDGRMARTLVGLSVRPGRMVRRYLAGQRVRYVGPFRYALATCAAWVVVQSVVQSGVEDEAVGFFLRYGQVLNLALVPVLGGLTSLLFLGSGFTVAEHLCLLFYLSGHAFLWRALLSALGASGLASAAVWNGIDQGLFVVYLVWGLVGFHRDRLGAVSLVLRTLLTLLAVGVVSSLAVQLAFRAAGVTVGEP